MNNVYILREIAKWNPQVFGRVSIASKDFYKSNTRKMVEKRFHHSDTDTDNTKFYYRNNKLHRADGPAVECTNGDKEWYWDGWRHRADGPAIEKADGTKEWYRDGQLHREDGPALIKYYADCFVKEWYYNDKLHRENGPAMEWSNGDCYYYKHGKLHRDDGPACIHPNGIKQWFRNGKIYCLQVNNRYIWYDENGKWIVHPYFPSTLTIIVVLFLYMTT